MGYIKKDFIKDLLDKVDVIDILSNFTTLKKQGANYFGLSPFIKEKSPSFCVSQVRQTYKDFASGKSGNVITFLMDHENFSYTEAVEWIAKSISLDVEYESEAYAKKKVEAEKKRQELRPILLSAQKKFRAEFDKLPKDHPAKKEIFERRKYTKDVALEWGVGYMPGNKFIYDLVYQKGITKEAAAVGLINLEKSQDKHWNRVSYPIHDKNGLLIGFASRDLSGKKKIAKWMNPPNSDIYKKENTWFGLNRAILSKQIQKTGEIWLVEGYNDVIAWHENGILNTVASCGTSIPDNLFKILKRYCKRINFCFDGDAAGKKAMKDYIPVFLKKGFTVNVYRLEGADPDEFVRLYPRSIAFFGLPEMMEMAGIKEDCFKILLEEYLKGSDIAIAQGAQKLCKIIAELEDEALAEIYMQWLEKESKVSKSTLNKWIKNYKTALLKEEPEPLTRYMLPKKVKVKFKEVETHVYNYGLFMANNKIWFALPENGEGQIHFTSVSNFEISVIQHMQDEKFPMKLIRLKNIHGLEKIFDIPSENLNKMQRFDDSITNFGNYQFTGDNSQFLRLRAFLFDNMGTGRKVDVLGWQPEGFWCWNNRIIIPGADDIVLDKNGICVFKDAHYYIPSANKIYRSNIFKYDAQKRFEIFEAKETFHTYVNQMMKVHRDHAISAVLFSIASVFQDIIVEQNGSFPIMFLYGPGSSGKDQLADCMQSFFGKPQTAINLEGNASTIKAKIREFAQFSNSMGHLSEYQRGPHDGIIKGLWDRRGYKRGNIESHVGTETIPIISSVILTGNEYPDAEPLIMRFLWNEMDKNVFDDQEMVEFDKLKDMTNAGISSYTDKIIRHREAFQKDFQQKYRGFKDSFQTRVPDAKSRMIQNTAVLGATYQIFKNIVEFPFTFNEMEKHFVSCVEKQIRKCTSASVLTRFWDCFLAILRKPKTERLQVQFDFKLEGGDIFFNFTNVFNKIQLQWYAQYKENSPGKATLKELLTKESSFVKYHSRGVYMGSGKSNTSAMQIELMKVEVEQEIIMAVEYQLNETNPWVPQEKVDESNNNVSPPATPGFFDILEK